MTDPILQAPFPHVSQHNPEHCPPCAALRDAGITLAAPAEGLREAAQGVLDAWDMDTAMSPVIAALRLALKDVTP